MTWTDENARELGDPVHIPVPVVTLIARALVILALVALAVLAWHR